MGMSSVAASERSERPAMSRTEQGVATSRDLGLGVGRSASSLFAVDVRSLPGEAVLTLHGELDISTQPLFASALAGVEESVARIVLDLSDLPFIDCGNIGLIHDTRIEVGLRGTYLELRSPKPHLLRIFELTGLVPTASPERVQHRIALPLPSRVHQRIAV
jgi:anti-anti-sigma factor